MDVLASRVLTLFRLVRPVKRVIYANLEKEWNKIKIVGRKHDLFFPSPRTYLSVSESSMDMKLHEQAINKRKKKDKPHEDDRNGRRNSKNPSSSSSSSLNLYFSPTGFEVYYTKIDAQKVGKQKRAKAEVPVLQTMKKNSAQTLDYRTRPSLNKSPTNDETVFRYIAELIKKFKWHMKLHYFNPKEPNSIINFPATFKLACDLNRIDKEAVMWVLPHYVHETLTNALNSRICAKNRVAPIIATMCNNNKRQYQQKVR